MRARAGFTLLEVVAAMAIFLVVALSLVSLSARSVHLAATRDWEQAAIQLVTDRTDQVLADPRYGAVDSLYAGTETGFASLPGFQRVTQVTRITANNNDFKRVTVTVTGPGLPAAVSRTITVAAP